ncbi:MAG: polyketide synthase, partial [Phormidesmis sp. RL_2_1]|nr:polyketide synthase [Phormidesmis sp. RL_2_1]
MRSEPAAKSALPFIQQIPQLQPNSQMTLAHTFSLASDPYLADHCLDGKPVLPAAAAAEWLAEFVQAAWPDQTVTALRDLRVLSGITVPPEGLSVRFCARASSHA